MVVETTERREKNSEKRHGKGAVGQKPKAVCRIDLA